MYFYSLVSPEDVTYGTAVQTVDGMKLMKDRHFLVMIDSVRRRRSASMFHIEDVV